MNGAMSTLQTGERIPMSWDEYDALVSWIRALDADTESDAIVIGDFNRFLNGKSKWKNLMVPGHANDFRFPLLEAIKNEVPTFDPKKHEAPEDKYSTTTSKKRSIYDQIIISSASYDEFVASPVFGTDVGIVDFDNNPAFEWFVASWTNATRMLSDHRPVWIRVSGTS